MLAINAAPSSFTFVLHGTKSYDLSAPTGVARSDVAKALNSSAAASAGYQLESKLDQVVPGSYQAPAWVKGAAGDTLCNTVAAALVNCAARVAFPSLCRFNVRTPNS